MPLSHSSRFAFCAWLVLLASTAGLPAVAADPVFPDGLTAREIYQRVLDNRFQTSRQSLELSSFDRAGNSQSLSVRMAWARYQEGTKEHSRGVTSKTILRYLLPRDLRGTGYLVINKSNGPTDQFVYLPSMRRVRRMHLRSQTIAGTDISPEDIVPRELDDATYVRIADAEVDGEPCFAVEATPTEAVESDYSRFLLLIDKQHYVPLRTRYWNAAGTQVKELSVVAGTVEEIRGVWIPRRSTMRQLIDETHTDLFVAEIEANPELPARTFSQRVLESRRIH